MKILFLIYLLSLSITYSDTLECYECGIENRPKCNLGEHADNPTCKTNKRCVRIKTADQTLMFCEGRQTVTSEYLGYINCVKARTGFKIMGRSYNVQQCYSCYHDLCNGGFKNLPSIVLVNFIIFVLVYSNVLHYN